MVGKQVCRYGMTVYGRYVHSEYVSHKSLQQALEHNLLIREVQKA